MSRFVSEKMTTFTAKEDKEDLVVLKELIEAGRVTPDRFTSARVALAARAGSATNWEELSETPKMAAYRTALAVDKQACTDLQAKLDATAERGVFEDAPWIPGELKEVVEAFLGCDGPHLENPEDVYRPPPTSTP